MGNLDVRIARAKVRGQSRIQTRLDLVPRNALFGFGECDVHQIQVVAIFEQFKEFEIFYRNDRSDILAMALKNDAISANRYFVRLVL